MGVTPGAADWREAMVEKLLVRVLGRAEVEVEEEFWSLKADWRPAADLVLRLLTRWDRRTCLDAWRRPRLTADIMMFFL